MQYSSHFTFAYEEFVRVVLEAKHWRHSLRAAQCRIRGDGSVIDADEERVEALEEGRRRYEA